MSLNKTEYTPYAGEDITTAIKNSLALSEKVRVNYKF